MNARASLWRDIALYTGLWTILGLFSASQSVIANVYQHQPFDLVHVYGTALLNWYTCGIGTPIYIWLVRRYPLRQPHLWLRVIAYIAIILCCVVLKYAVWVPLQNAIFHSNWSFAQMFVPSIFPVMIEQIYFVILLYAIEYYRIARERALQASQLEAALSQAQLETLRSQLQPHFLFNTLNSIAALMHRDVDAADEMLTRLSSMLRLMLESGNVQEVQLRNELQTLNLYMEIMQVRFGERLSTEIDVGEQLLDERVPSLLLQPLVENVVRHGIDESSKSTNIRVSAEASGHELVMRIIDNGRGLPAPEQYREGIGLRNTRRRLERLYGKEARLDILRRDGGGAEVVIAIPRHASYVTGLARA